MTKLLKLLPNERIEVLPIPRSPKGNKYAITNYGRILSFQKEPKEGNLLKSGVVSGYPSLSVRVKGNNKTFLIHRLVAKYFLKQPDKSYKYVIHLNNVKEDNHYKNLKWTTFDQMQEHMQADRRLKKIGNYKLTEARVLMIKKQLADGKKTLKEIAERFKVTDMQIHRIKTGENWSHVKLK